MKLFLKSIIYLLLIICLTAASVLLYKEHPEVQLAFIIPGIFIFAYSMINDDIGVKHKLRFSKEK